MQALQKQAILIRLYRFSFKNESESAKGVRGVSNQKDDGDGRNWMSIKERENYESCQELRFHNN